MTRSFPTKAAIKIFVALICYGAGGPVSGQYDRRHFSQVFQTEKPYRIYLPKNYSSTGKRFPVIYFFHGNKGSEKLPFSGIQRLADSCQVIFVAWNGRSKPGDERPYNIGYHPNINYRVQFKDYFPEFVNFIDHHYRTLSDRAHRATMGHSMGGFMSFYLAGKYPDMVGAALSAKGSPEFFIGYPDNHSLYSMRYMFRNLVGVKIRFHNGTEGEEMSNLNQETNEGAKLTTGLDYTYKEYYGGHGMSEAEFADGFRFLASAFGDAVATPVRWHHSDLYSRFKVWGYEVRGHLRAPGFIDLKGVTKGGMGVVARKWEPDGRYLPDATIDVSTAPVYQPVHTYRVFDFNESDSTRKISPVKSDAQGKVNFSLKPGSHQIGILDVNSPAELVFLQHRADNRDIFLGHHKQSRVAIRLLNRGGTEARNVRVRISSPNPGIRIDDPEINVGDIGNGQPKWSEQTFGITADVTPPADGSPFKVRFDLSLTDDQGHTWADEFDAPVFYDVPEFKNIGIDDGDSEVFGSGNGDNVADPGETVMIYQHSNRTRLYYDDPYIDDERLHDDLQPDKWGDGYALSSLIHISKNCPPGHRIRFLASYEVKEWTTIKRNVTWGWFSIEVGKGSSGIKQ